MQIQSDAFEPNDTIPDRHAREGDDLSPPLRWSDLPANTKALSLLVEDPDAPGGSFTHWLLWNIPVSRDGLDEDVKHRGWFADEARQGDNDFDERGWSGPRPPEGENHRYVFHLYALDEPLPLEDGATREEVEKAMKGHILGEAKLVGTYAR
ncbi:MAG TPA: YbhB/YbcL family Raf kinase inhibitor-like protein [Sandaracinaceae bacterium LLY-WYZ-13_1]|nr:YbhB/YbcL family Raf kinase inhibitor-like protein [Sandaracinaceae bacterium LLY-WYZ-13_1]